MTRNLSVEWSERLCEVVFWELDDIQAYLEQFYRIAYPQGSVQRTEDGILCNHGPQETDFTCCVPADFCDPTSRAIMLGKACFGMHWPQSVPNLLEKVTHEWRRRQKAKIQIYQTRPHTIVTGTMKFLD